MSSSTGGPEPLPPPPDQAAIPNPPPTSGESRQHTDPAAGPAEKPERQAESCGTEIPREGVAARVQEGPPTKKHKSVAVESRVVPCPEPASFPAGIDSRLAGVDVSRIARFRQPSGLALTAVTAAGGRPLFSVLHHEVFDVHELDNQQLAQLPDEELKPLLDDYLLATDVDERNPLRRILRLDVDNFREWMWRGSRHVPKLAEQLQTQASRHMAWMTANAALAADSEKTQLALDGAIVNLYLFNISIPEPGGLQEWDFQQKAFSYLQDQGPIVLCARASDGAQCPVRVHVIARQIVFSRDLEFWAHLRRSDNHPSIEADVSLLGDLRSPALGGDVRTRVDQMTARAEGLSNELAALEQVRTRTARNLGADHSECLDMSRRLCGMQEEKEHLESNAHYLEQAGQQLKHMRSRSHYWPGDPVDRNRAAARLALVAHLMGATPVLSCAAGRGLISPLEPEIKHLATVIDNHERQLPPVD